MLIVWESERVADEATATTCEAHVVPGKCTLSMS